MQVRQDYDLFMIVCDGEPLPIRIWTMGKGTLGGGIGKYDQDLITTQLRG